MKEKGQTAYSFNHHRGLSVCPSLLFKYFLDSLAEWHYNQRNEILIKLKKKSVKEREGEIVRKRDRGPVKRETDRGREE